MSGQKNAVVFDWNGTVIDDAHACVQATNATLALFELPGVTLSQYQSAYTIPLRDMYTLFGCSLEQIELREAEFLETFFHAYEAATRSLTLRTGAKQALQELKKINVKRAVLSNYTIPKIKAQAQKLGVLPFFDAILANVDGGHVLHKGGKGDRLKAYMDENDIRQAVVIGDTVEEVHIARAQGCVAVALSGGACSTERLACEKPDFLIEELDELPSIVSKIFR